MSERLTRESEPPAHRPGWAFRLKRSLAYERVWKGTEGVWGCLDPLNKALLKGALLKGTLYNIFIYSYEAVLREPLVDMKRLF